MSKCLRCGAGSEWLEGRVKPESDAITPYLDALQRYSDGWYELALKHGMRAAVAASHAKHMQDAINGIRALLSEGTDIVR